MFNHSIAVVEEAVAADTVLTRDLPTNPLSVVLIAIRPLNDTGTLANFADYRAVCAALNRVSILYRGESIVGMRGEDLAALNYFRHGILPFQGQHDNTNDERRCVVLPILLGRSPYDPMSCFPRTKRGDLQLELDIDIADTGYDGFRFSVETIELMDAKPKEFEKKVQVTQTPAATGDVDMQLPLGADCRGLLLFGTTPFAGAAPAPSWGRVRTLLDNREAGFSATDFEVAQMLHSLAGRMPPIYSGFQVGTTVDGNAQTSAPSNGAPFNVGIGWHQYAWLDFDPTYDDRHTIKPQGKDFRIRFNAETADAVRCVPIEVLPANTIRME